MIEKIDLCCNPRHSSSKRYYSGYTDAFVYSCSSSPNIMAYASIVVQDSVARSLLHDIKTGETICLKTNDSPDLVITKDDVSFVSKHIRDRYTHIIMKHKDGKKSNTYFSSAIFSDIENKSIDLKYSEIPAEISDKLYDILQEDTTVPVLKEWMPYITKKMALMNGLFWGTIDGDYTLNHGIRHLNNNHGFNSVVCVKFCCHDIIAIIKEGLAAKELSIDGCNSDSQDVQDVSGMDNYVATFGQVLADKTKEVFRPRFDPERDELEHKVDAFYNIAGFYTKGIKSYKVQKNVIQGAINTLNKEDNVMIAAATGTGKTILGIGSVCCHAKKDDFNVIVAVPSNLESRWEEAIKAVVPMSEVVTIHNFHEFTAAVKRANCALRMRSFWMIASYNTLKSNYEIRPAAIYDDRKKAYVCPDCGEVLKVKRKRDRYGRNLNVWEIRETNLDDISFFKQDEVNEYCPKCHSKLWTAATKSNSKDWLKLKNVGWVYRTRVKEIENTMKFYLDNLVSNAPKSMRNEYEKIIKAISEYRSNGVVERYPKSYQIAHYMKKNMKNFFDYAIFDEVHSLAGDSLQGDAFGNVCNSSWKSIFLTGTLSNGYASGLFHLLFRTQTKKMIDMGYGYNSIKDFNDEYGVKEQTLTEHGTLTGPKENPHFRTRSRTNKTKYLPGISPVLFADFLMNNMIVTKKEDIRKDLCDYSEIPVGVVADAELTDAYKNVLASVQYTAGGRRIFTRRAIQNAVLTATMFLDQPFGIDTTNRETGEVIELDPDKIRNKETKLVEICKEKKAAGEMILIYCEYTRKLEIVDRLSRILKENGINAIGMPDTVKMNNRQHWLEDRAQDDETDAVILNPTLVGTGLNLLDYTTIIFYEVGTKVTTVRQASQRSNRINQDHPVSVYFMYYKDTIQEDALGIISQKISASKSIEGDFSESALQEVGEDEDTLMRLAKCMANDEHISVDNKNFETVKYSNDEKNAEIAANSSNDFGFHFEDRRIFEFEEPSRVVEFF